MSVQEIGETEQERGSNSDPRNGNRTGGGWVKLEIPLVESKHDTNLRDNIVQSNKTLFFESLRAHNLQYTASQPHLVGELDCEEYFEINIQIFCENFRPLLDVSRDFYDRLYGERLRPHEKANLVVVSPKFFSDQLVCAMPNVPLTAIYFGNVQGNVFMNHWEVSFTDEVRERHKRSRKNTKLRCPPQADKLYSLKADFEFDKNDLLTVHFRNRELKRVLDERFQEPKQQEVTMFYTLLVKRLNIRRIVCDPYLPEIASAPNSSVNIHPVRLHFELNCPVLIRAGHVTDAQIKASQKANKDGESIYPQNMQRTLLIRRGRSPGTSVEWPNPLAIADSPFFTLQLNITHDNLHVLLSRFKARTNISIEMASMPLVDALFGCRNPYHKWTHKSDGRELAPTDYDDATYSKFINKLWPRSYDEMGNDVNRERRFAFTYLIEALISRGAIVKDQILLDLNCWYQFLQIIVHYCLVVDSKLCEAALEDLIHVIDGRKRIGSICKCLVQICQNRHINKLSGGLTEEEFREGYQRVRKIVFTPTRVIYVAPETLMGNRVLRKYDSDGTKILRISFRDDDNMKMRGTKTSDYIIHKTVEKFLVNGIVVAGYDFGYLGSSNSQMRDNGAYFMQKYSLSQKKEFLAQNAEAAKEYKKTGMMPPTFIPRIREARKALGRFDQIESVPKLMARLGQCFTQSRLSGVRLQRENCIVISDVIGGQNNKGQTYTFSDGVGMISASFSRQIAKHMRFGRGVPSCYQFRFRGMKGVLSIDPHLDEISAWAKRNHISEPLSGHIDEPGSWTIHCAFRPSQIKFTSKRHPGDQIEIVKYSSPVAVSLNKPFINILDQVSEMQSLSCHRRVTSRIEELLDIQIRDFASMMTDEVQCRNKLKELPRRFDIDVLSLRYGFTLSSEPFFRSLLKAVIKYQATKQLRKEQIRIPSELGRSMLGVIDETGQLQYGQVFVQYTKNITLKCAPGTASREVLTGQVLMTKNPCIVPGDVRVFQAVDVPELHHHCDVVVFPQSGPRPHPDEMAGSDLDGDEYSVIWDPHLLLDRNEPAFDFSADKNVEPFDENNMEQLMIDFYIKYLKLDSVGTISNNHLHQSDQYGLKSNVCMKLAKKNSQAVDFTKTGQPPLPLVKVWKEDDDGNEVPPERAERVPDYHFGNEFSPAYISPRLCGRIYREFKAVEDVIKISEERDERVTLDPDMDWPDWERFEGRARKALAKYNTQLRSLMDNYGIATEGEIFSGYEIEVRNRISDKDQDDMSFYNTNQVIDTKMHNLYRTFRIDFFEEFGRDGWKRLTTKSERSYADDSNPFHRLCKHPSDDMFRKAVAYYRVCYEEARRNPENKKLSFAWLAYDILAEVKKRKSHAKETITTTRSPIYEILDRHREEYIRENEDSFTDFLEKRIKITRKQKEDVTRIITRYTQTYPGLEGVLFILLEWADRCHLFKKSSSFREHHLCLLFILFITNYFETKDPIKVHYETDIFLPFLSPSEPLPAPEALPIGRASRITLSFFEFLSSRAFRRLTSISFSKLGFLSVFSRGQWLPLHQSGIKTYYNILFNLRFEELPLSTDPPLVASAIAREHESLVIELPENVNTSEMEEILRTETGLEQVRIRRFETAFRNDSINKPKSQINKYILSSRGTLEAFYELKKIVFVKIQVKTSSLTKELSTQLAQLTYEKIVNAKSRETVASSLW